MTRPTPERSLSTDPSAPRSRPMLRAEAPPVGAGLTAQTHAPRLPRAAIPFAVVTVLFAPMAYVSMFNGFHAYDDEGFFLVTIRDFLSGHPLLTPYVPLYGPFFYELMGGLFKLLGLQPTHDVGRWVTLAIWLTSSI